jgi:hypothetical protein
MRARFLRLLVSAMKTVRMYDTAWDLEQSQRMRLSKEDATYPVDEKTCAAAYVSTLLQPAIMMYPTIQRKREMRRP